MIVSECKPIRKMPLYDCKHDLRQIRQLEPKDIYCFYYQIHLKTPVYYYRYQTINRILSQ